MEIRHSRRLKSDRVGEAASKGSLRDNTFSDGLNPNLLGKPG
jgi:hypothetical protein